MTTRSVHLLFDPQPDHLRLLEAVLDERIRVSAGHKPPQPADFHVLVAGRPTEAELTASPRLERLIVPYAGLSVALRELILKHDHIHVHNLHHNAGNVAEMALALLLAAAKFIVPFDRKLRDHDWTPRYSANPAVILGGKTAVILGYGAIGRALTPMLVGLGMTVKGTRRSLRQAEVEGNVALLPTNALEELLPTADALIVCMPLTEETEGLIGRRELDLMPPRSMLVNVGRGPIVEEAALYRALCDGRLHAAGLDVWYNYPTDEASRTQTPPSNHPLYELDNVVLSPHRAGMFGVEETEHARMAALAQLLNADARGETVPNQVDVARGY